MTSNSLTQALSIALSGLQATTSLISLASKNISNASTPGYTEKSATIQNVDFGNEFGGVLISSYNRASSDALTTDYNTATSAASYTSTQNKYVTQIQVALDSTSSPPALVNDIANFSAAWSTYSSTPETNSAKQGVISAGRTLATDIRTAVINISTLKTQIKTDISTSLKTMNAALRDIATVNKQIQQAVTSGQPTVDLQDQRDADVNIIAQYMNVTTQNRANGQIALYTPSGLSLVDEQSVQQYSFNGTSIVDGNSTDVTSALSGGSLQAATDFISTTASALSDPTSGVGTIGKFIAQFSKLCDAFTNSSGTTTSLFATSYASAVTASTANGATQAGQTLATSFFTVANGSNGLPDSTTFNVNSNVLSGTSGIPQTSVTAIADSFNNTATYTTSGLLASSVTYAGLTSTILSNFQQDANIISSQTATASSQQNYYKQSIANQTGVNTDTELANLVTYQNSYAASAHVLSTVNQMLSTLMNSIQ